jgi:hypothetical protein
MLGNSVDNKLKETKVMEKKHLKDNKYQVIDNNNNVLFQGSELECNEYIMDKGMENLLNRINNSSELLNVFKRLNDR